jgi:hypothetical protein
MRNRKQHGQIIRIGDRWYVRYWERRYVSGNVERKRVTHQLGPVTTRGKRPPADIKTEAERHMATINSGTIPVDRIVTISDFVERVYLPWVELHKRPSTVKGYRDHWEDHLKLLCGPVWLKDARTFHVQGWLNEIAAAKLSRNTLKHIKSTISGIFTLAKQQDYFQAENPARDTKIDPRAAEPQETYAYSLEELQSIISLLPEPAATAFAVAGYMGLRHGEIQGYCGRTTEMANSTFLAQSGMAESTTLRLARDGRRCRLYGNWRSDWNCIDCGPATLRPARYSPMQ